MRIQNSVSVRVRMTSAWEEETMALPLSPFVRLTRPNQLPSLDLDKNPMHVDQNIRSITLNIQKVTHNYTLTRLLSF